MASRHPISGDELRNALVDRTVEIERAIVDGHLRDFPLTGESLDAIFHSFSLMIALSEGYIPDRHWRRYKRMARECLSPRLELFRGGKKRARLV